MRDRYLVMVRPRATEPKPRHPYFPGTMPGPDECYRFWFVLRRPTHPLTAHPGECLYVEDFLDMYEDVTVRLLDPVKDDFGQLFGETRYG